MIRNLSCNVGKMTKKFRVRRLETYILPGRSEGMIFVSEGMIFVSEGMIFVSEGMIFASDRTIFVSKSKMLSIIVPNFLLCCFICWQRTMIYLFNIFFIVQNTDPEEQSIISVQLIGYIRRNYFFLTG